MHITRLLDDFTSLIAETPVALADLSAVIRLRVREATGDPHFDDDGTYIIPTATNPNERVIQRAWHAHGIAHVILAKDAGERPICRPRAQALGAEREATYLAGLILIPSAALAANRRLSPVGALFGGDEVGAALDEIMSDFDALATFAAVRLAEEALLVELPL
ncbi:MULTISPECIES: hypothetical protein [Rhodococcus]|uniref:hypothetical protein n=1 Tax=Rhodococcus TaxID=1827 RepID=UPI00029A3D31|nr:MULTISPECIES: hypothetical protein [Rhodococcus]